MSGWVNLRDAKEVNSKYRFLEKIFLGVRNSNKYKFSENEKSYGFFIIYKKLYAGCTNFW